MIHTRKKCSELEQIDNMGEINQLLIFPWILTTRKDINHNFSKADMHKTAFLVNIKTKIIKGTKKMVVKSQSAMYLHKITSRLHLLHI
jgi:hypothetical protein